MVAKSPKFSFKSYKDSLPFPKDIRAFLDREVWVSAKTYAKTWPHEYLVRERVDEALFVKTIKHIRKRGRIRMFYARPVIYFDEDGLTYWTMTGPHRGHKDWVPISAEGVINRCSLDQTFEARRKRGDLPK
jgi:hypothetical protein